MITLALEITDPEVVEVIIYGIAILFIIIGLFVIIPILRICIGSKIRSTMNPYAMSPDDLKKLQAKGQLTEEEAKAVKRAMARRFLERAKEDEKVRSLPANAELVLSIEAERQLKEASARKPPLTRAELNEEEEKL